MNAPMLHLSVLEGEFSICRLDSNVPVPVWALADPFVSLTRTGEELSIVVRQEAVPSNVLSERGWRCLKVAGPLDFALTGILAALCGPLAAARIPVFSISTFDTDYLLVRASDLEAAITALESAGHSVLDATPPE